MFVASGKCAALIDRWCVDIRVNDDTSYANVGPIIRTLREFDSMLIDAERAFHASNDAADRRATTPPIGPAMRLPS